MRHLYASCAIAGIACLPASADYLAVSWFRGELWRLNEQTGTTQLIGQLGVAWRANALTVSSDGRYFVTATSSTAASEWLFEVNPDTGASQALFATGIEDVRDMSFAPDGTLRMVENIGANAGRIHTVSLDTQSVVSTTDLFAVAPAQIGFQGFAIDQTGNAYMAGPNARLARVNLDTGAVVRIPGATNLLGVQGLAFNPSDELVAIGYETGAIDAQLWTYNQSTGALLSTLSIQRQDFRGLAWVVPAPSGLALLAAAIIPAARRRR